MQFYLGTWLHMRGLYPLHMEGQQNHEVADDGRCKVHNYINGGQAK